LTSRIRDDLGVTRTTDTQCYHAPTRPACYSMSTRVFLPRTNPTRSPLMASVRASKSSMSFFTLVCSESTCVTSSESASASSPVVVVPSLI